MEKYYNFVGPRNMANCAPVYPCNAMNSSDAPCSIDHAGNEIVSKKIKQSCNMEKPSKTPERKSILDLYLAECVCALLFLIALVLAINTK